MDTSLTIIQSYIMHARVFAQPPSRLARTCVNFQQRDHGRWNSGLRLSLVQSFCGAKEEVMKIKHSAHFERGCDGISVLHNRWTQHQTGPHSPCARRGCEVLAGLRPKRTLHLDFADGFVSEGGEFTATQDRPMHHITSWQFAVIDGTAGGMCLSLRETHATR